MPSVSTIAAIAFGFLTVCNLILPQSLFVIVLVATLSVSGLAYFIYQGWETSDPNQWLLIIGDGKMVKGGIGLKAFRWPNQTCVRFQSEIRKINFNAEQVTKEMQGLNVSGFAIWGVYRNEDGPLKCYQYTQSSNADDNVKTLCESIVRNCISNTQMMDVIKNRHKLRDQMKKEIQKQVQGWGVWMETIEITEVKISSQNLFKDLQIEFRNEKRLIAEKCSQTNSKLIGEATVKYQVELETKKQEIETQKLDFQNQQALQVEQAKTTFITKKLNKEKQKLEDDQVDWMKQLEKTTTLAQLTKKTTQERTKLKEFHEMQMKNQLSEAYGKMTVRNLRKYELDKTADLFSAKQYSMERVDVTNFVGEESIQGMPLLAMLTQQNQKLLEQ